ncbi:MAG TPA: hypothetical protein VFB14_16235 [Bryobacteraceae bacterium]|jgi:hypothetical protein|nr:hypothetical protein [Bryobacteraceae bacterium]
MKLYLTPMFLKAVVSTLAVTFVVLSSHPARAQSEASDGDRSHNACSDRTLLGDYGAKIEGTLSDLPGKPSLTSVVFFHFNGDRTMTSKRYAVLDGKPVVPDWTDDPGPATYELKPDCTGSADSVNPPIKFHFVVVDHGRKLFLVIDGGATTGVAEKVGRQGHPHE